MLFADSSRFSSELCQITGTVKLKDGDVVDTFDIISDLTINIRLAGIRRKDTGGKASGLWFTDPFH